MDTKDIIYQLAKGLSQQISKIKYGQMRKNLKRNGFSEIAMYSAVARHLEENSIQVKDFLDDMELLLRQSSKNPFFPKIDNGFAFLAGQYHDLRHGDLATGGAKSPEQRGMYLCNHCFQIKQDKDRCKRKNYSHTCNSCYLEVSREYAKSSNSRRKAAKEELARKQAVAAAQPVKAEPTPDVMEDKILAAKEVKTVKAAKPTRVKMAKPMAVSAEPVTQVAELVLDQPRKLAKIEEITGDQDNTLIQLSCNTAELHKVLGMLATLA